MYLLQEFPGSDVVSFLGPVEPDAVDILLTFLISPQSLHADDVRVHTLLSVRRGMSQKNRNQYTNRKPGQFFRLL